MCPSSIGYKVSAFIIEEAPMTSKNEANTKGFIEWDIGLVEIVGFRSELI